MILNRGEMADVLGKEPGTLDRWTREGAPVLDRPGQGRAAKFDSAAVINWAIAREVERALERAEAGAAAEDLEEWRTRKMAAQAQLAEIEVARARGELVLADEIGRAMHDLITGGREYVRRVAPGRIARRVVGETDEGTIRRAAQEEIELGLTDWSEKAAIDAVADAGGRVSERYRDHPCPMCATLAELAETGEALPDAD